MQIEEHTFQGNKRRYTSVLINIYDLLVTVLNKSCSLYIKNNVAQPFPERTVLTKVLYSICIVRIKPLNRIKVFWFWFLSGPRCLSFFLSDAVLIRVNTVRFLEFFLQLFLQALPSRLGRRWVNLWQSLWTLLWQPIQSKSKRCQTNDQKWIWEFCHHT